MNEKDLNEFLAILKKEAKRKVTKEEAEATLKRIGILTKKGNVAKPYKDICSFPKQV
jgi:hypothetical protein